MPAAAVIPAPIAYTNVVAVKKLVVGFHVAVLLSLFESDGGLRCILLLLFYSGLH